MKKRILSILLCLCMALGLLPTLGVPAAASGDNTTLELGDVRLIEPHVQFEIGYYKNGDSDGNPTGTAEDYNFYCTYDEADGKVVLYLNNALIEGQLKTIEIADFKVQLTGDNLVENNWAAIYFDGQTEICGDGTLTVSSYCTNACGISARDLTINADVNVSAVSTSSWAYGIKVSGTLTVEGGVVTVSAVSQSGDESYGMNSTTVNITGGTVNAYGSTYGIKGDTITIARPAQGDSVTAIGGTQGVDATVGLTIRDSAATYTNKILRIEYGNDMDFNAVTEPVDCTGGGDKIGFGYSYNASNNKLWLETAAYLSGGVTLPHGATVETKGFSVVTDFKTADNTSANAIVGNGDLTLTGKGTLLAVGTASGEANSGNSNGCGVNTYGNMTVGMTGRLMVVGAASGAATGSNEANGNGLWAGGDLSVTGGTVIPIGYGTETAAATGSVGNTTVNDVKLIGVGVGSEEGCGICTVGVNNGNNDKGSISVTGGRTTLFSSGVSAGGIYAGFDDAADTEISVSGAVVDLLSVGKSKSYGLCSGSNVAQSKLSIDDSDVKVCVKTTDTEENTGAAHGIYTLKTQSIELRNSGVDVTVSSKAKGDTKSDTSGIATGEGHSSDLEGDILITSDTVKKVRVCVSGKDSSGDPGSYGIYAADGTYDGNYPGKLTVCGKAAVEVSANTIGVCATDMAVSDSASVTIEKAECGVGLIITEDEDDDVYPSGHGNLTVAGGSLTVKDAQIALMSGCSDATDADVGEGHLTNCGVFTFSGGTTELAGAVTTVCNAAKDDYTKTRVVTTGMIVTAGDAYPGAVVTDFASDYETNQMSTYKYVKIEQMPYTVTFASGGGTGTDPSQADTVAGSTFALPLNPYTRSGYTFSGWNDGTTTYAVGATYTMPANKVTFTAQWTANASNPGGYTGGGSSTPSSGSADPVYVDGKEHDIGKQTVSGEKTTVTVDQTKLTEQIDKATTDVLVPVGDKTDTAVAQLVVKNVEDMAKKDMTLAVQTGDVTYQMPTTAVDCEKVMTELGATNPADVPVNVTITNLKEGSVTTDKGAVVLNPVEFTVTATYGGKTAEVERFSQYVQRVIEMPAGYDSSKITTAIRTDDGEHVPTEVYQKDGKYYATINSLTNSTYVLIFNDQRFADADGKWYEAAADEMASRCVIFGRTNGKFDGEANVTRAEFAAIIVRALGLPEEGSSSFSDVSSTAWCAGAIGAATEYGIIYGYTDGAFRPNKNITRQEAMAMIQRAAKVAEFAGTTGDLTAFSDADTVGAWAKEAVAFNVGSGLILGTDGKLNVTAPITRAQTAVVILRLLQKAELVDVRSTT